MHNRRLTLSSLGVLAAVVLCDQLSKWAVVNSLEPHTPYPVVGEWFRLFVVRNPGAAFSLGADATIIFSVFQAIAVVMCVILAFRARTWRGVWPIGFIGGGAAGNLIDRIFRDPGGFHGHVVDFLSFWSFAIFNCADAAITVGVVLYLFNTLILEPRREVSA